MANEIVELPRGGTWVKTSAGPIQFGIPPETIKDLMEAKLDAPIAYVVPRDPFDRARGVNVAEFEFPAYYAFFFLHRRARLVVETPELEQRLRDVLHESLLGPARVTTADEYPREMPEDGRANFPREGDHFRNVEGGKRIDLEALIEFVHAEPTGVARIAPGVDVKCGKDDYTVIDGGREIARVSRDIHLPPRAEISLSGEPFDPPEFGVTVLGASHGFDPKGRTTGFVLWIAGRGLLVDPPAFATDDLRAGGVPTKLVEGIILTHCHADHDAGTFQKILEEGRLPLYTTPTVLGSFLRKYSALSGLSEDVVRRTFRPRPVRVGEPTWIHGAEVRFFYALHSIPSVAFVAYYRGKSIAFSADTLYDPVRIKQMENAGVIGARRAKDLLEFPWHADLVLHEAGIPPLHTPVSALAALPADAKKNLRLVHIAAKDIPLDSGLVAAPIGVENTIRLALPPPEREEAVSLLDLFCDVDLFADFTLSQARELLRVARRAHYVKGTKIIEEGSSGTTFYVIARGEADVVRGGKAFKTYGEGDYFGETALILGRPRNADVLARTDLETVEIDRAAFLALLRGTDLADRLQHLAEVRAERSWEILERNSHFRTMTSAQKTKLQSILQLVSFKAGEVLWNAGASVERAFVVEEGTLSLEQPGNAQPLAPFGASAFIGEVDALLAGDAHFTTLRAASAGKAFALAREPFAAFLRENPGVLIGLMGTRFAE